MIYQALPVEDALRLAQAKPWAYIKNMSSMHLGENPVSLDLTQVLDARFFDGQQEIRLLREEGTLHAYAFTKEADDDCIDSTGTPLPGFGSSFTKHSYIRYDDDGQAYIAAVCLAGWRE